MSTTSLSEAKTGAANYRLDIRAAVRGLWKGVFDYYQFFDSMISTIQRRLTQAWYEGAEAVGVQPSELTPEERLALRNVISDEINHVDDFAQEIAAGSQANGGKLTPLLRRAEMWAARYEDVVNRAKLMAGKDQKLQWTINYTRVVKVNCPSCLKLSGKIKRASYWQREDVHPQQPPNPKLECEGWQCGCGLVPTDEPCTPGPLPKLP